jgi:1-aminocyclopropane-1-carboxylate deaminase
MVKTGTGGINDYLKRGWMHPVKHPLLFQHHIATDILRLDRIHPQISGNKWLKLHHWMEKFRDGNYKGILTAGGPWSNHLHACGFACKLAGIKMHALVKGYEGMQNPMLDDLRNWNVPMRFAGRTEFYDRVAQENYALQNELLLIPMGGDGPEGVNGVKDFFDLLPLDEYDFVFCSVGTGTTLAGIAASKHAFSNIIGTDPGTGDRNLSAQIATLQEKYPRKKISLLSSGNKMGKPGDEMVRFMNDWFHKTGIPLDMVYTAPMCKLLLEMGNAGEFEQGERALLVHTGGLQGNRSVQGLEY